LVFELEPMYATSDRQTDGRTTDADHRLMPPLRGGGIIMFFHSEIDRKNRQKKTDTSRNTRNYTSFHTAQLKYVTHVCIIQRQIKL